MTNKPGIVSVKKYLESNGDKIPMGEIRDFWNSCSDEDKEKMGAAAAAELDKMEKEKN